MSLKAKIEAIVYAAEEPITVEQIAQLVREDVFAELAPEGSAEPAELASGKRGKKSKEELAVDATICARVQELLNELIADCAAESRGIEVRQVAGGYRMATKAEHHEVVRAFAKSLKPPLRLSLPALETLAVIAYKQPVTVPEISEIRGVETSGVIGTLLDRKLITTAGRKQVIGRPILYKTSKEFLLRFGLNDLSELPSMEEFEKFALAGLEPETAQAQSSLPLEAEAAAEEASPELAAEQPANDVE